MTHYAKVQKGIVKRVIAAEPEFFATFVDDEPGQYIQTSYNTQGNLHKLGGVPLRGNYAGVGYVYDYANDVFYPPQPYPSWSLNEATWTWEAPTPRPDDGAEYRWDESSGQWLALE